LLASYAIKSIMNIKLIILNLFFTKAMNSMTNCG